MAGTRNALLIGASRGLGLGLAREFAGRGWSVTATARDPGGATALGAVAGVQVERCDITEDASVVALHGRAGGPFDLVFVIAGIAEEATLPVHEVSREAAGRVFETNALAPLRVMEAFADRLAAGGTMAVMTSVLGSVSENTGGGWEIYRASKAALNTLTRCYALRHAGMTVLSVHPGWVRTEMGGEGAPLDVETSAVGMCDVIEAAQGGGGHRFVDWEGKTIGW